MGFQSGNDDYMEKPIDVDEMVLRVGALLLRSRIIIDRSQTIGSTKMEMDSFLSLPTVDHKRSPKGIHAAVQTGVLSQKIFSRNQWMDEIWEYDPPSDNHTVDFHVGSLRDRFGDNGDFKIVTIRGVDLKVVRQ